MKFSTKIMLFYDNHISYEKYYVIFVCLLRIFIYLCPENFGDDRAFVPVVEKGTRVQIPDSTAAVSSFQLRIEN